jgi:hypothetical protein
MINGCHAYSSYPAIIEDMQTAKDASINIGAGAAIYF